MLPILAMLVGLGCLICFIIVLIKQFQNAGAIHGIIGIITCSIWTLIWGWMNAAKLNIKNIMMIWTVLLILYFILAAMGGVSFSYSLGAPPTNLAP